MGSRAKYLIMNSLVDYLIDTDSEFGWSVK
jgi:hypothetical protein